MEKSQKEWKKDLKIFLEEKKRGRNIPKKWKVAFPNLEMRLTTTNYNPMNIYLYQQIIAEKFSIK